MTLGQLRNQLDGLIQRGAWNPHAPVESVFPWLKDLVPPIEHTNGNPEESSNE